MGFSLASEAKQIELLFNQTVQQELSLDQTKCSLKNQQVTIQNSGDAILKNCLPCANRSSFYTLDKIASQITQTDHPLQALYKIWTDSVQIVETNDETLQDPIYILNFKGYCNKKDFIPSFVKLCSLLGIDARPVTRQGKECYDFCYEGNHWEFLNPLSGQIYLGLDNRSLVSSEEVMDDPFLALRTKHNKTSSEVDFKDAWLQLAGFKIINSQLPDEIASNPSENELYQEIGFDLFPKEQVIYHASATNMPSQLHVEHVIDSQNRFTDGSFSYSSPFPLQKICNNTDAVISIEVDKAVKIVNSGDMLEISNDKIFSLTFFTDQNTLTGAISIYSACSEHLLPGLTYGINQIDLGIEANKSTVEIKYDLEESSESPVLLKVTNPNTVFDHCAPFFNMETTYEAAVEKICWQISPSSSFSVIPSNFEQVESFNSTIRVPAITDTFFNDNESYFFRAKAYVNGQWGEWSQPFAFTTRKAETPTSIDFNKLEGEGYEISWKAIPGDHTEYLVFGSNSLDFIPSVYSTTQINAIVDGQIADEEVNNNLQFTTTDTKVIVDGTLAYYRIIAQQNDHLSVPSKLIHVYDNDLIQPRNVLQTISNEAEQVIAKRIEIPLSYSQEDGSDQALITQPTLINYENVMGDLHSFVLRQAEAIQPYVRSNTITDEAWEATKPYFLPENHPVKPKLDRMFSTKRVMLNSESFRAAGFSRYKPGRVSHIMASGHPSLQGYFIKGFPDDDTMIKYDWRKLVHRIVGAQAVRQCIKKHHLEKKFAVPHKWIYPLPENPPTPKNSKFLRKNFILVAEDMRIYEHEVNNKRYKKHMTKQLLDNIYTILDEVGLYDSVYAFNVPFCKDGRLAFIDTEWHHRWPVPYQKFTKYFSSDMKKYWEKLIKNKGPKKKKSK